MLTPCNSCSSLPIFINEGDANHMQRLLNHSPDPEVANCPARTISIIVETDEAAVEQWNSIFIPPDRRT
jgi:hypothetical protein